MQRIKRRVNSFIGMFRKEKYPWIMLIILIFSFLTVLASSGSHSIPGDCCLVMVCLGDNHEIISYRRDAKYPADIIIERTKFNGQDAIHQYKKEGGYFTHLIITEEGWIIGIGGKDDPSINKELEKLGSEIISKNKIEEKDIEQANNILKENTWGFFIIQSPEKEVGLAVYDKRVRANKTKIFKIKNGEYVKINNNPRYYEQGNFKEIDKDPLKAALKITATDPYGLHRRDIITYEYNQGDVKVWASFDGGKLLEGATGSPDDIKFLGHEIPGEKIPTVPNKKFLGNESLQEKPKGASITPILAIIIIIIFIIFAKGMKTS
ncbi:MAG TPA: hypothetical protein PKW85_07210 [Methanothermobacter sp.]|nr:hypothetical protein [Methanothermobacter sp.]